MVVVFFFYIVPIYCESYDHLFQDDWGWHFYIVDDEITFDDSWDVLVAEHYIYLAEPELYIATAMRVGNKRRQVEVEADLNMK